MRINQMNWLVLDWAHERGLLTPDNYAHQMLKTTEEVGELAGAIARNNRDGIRDAIGDIIVTLIIQARKYDLTIEECLEHAWNEIKDRTGKTVDGVFIKDNE